MKEITLENISQLSGEHFKNYAPKAYADVYKFTALIVSIIIVSLLRIIPGEPFSFSVSFMLCIILWAVIAYPEKDVYEYIGEHSKALKISFVQRRIDYLKETYVIPHCEERYRLKEKALISLVLKNNLGVGQIINTVIANPLLADDCFPQIAPLLEKCIEKETIAFRKREENVTRKINNLNNLLTILKNQ